ncbi:hypothetical protein ABTM24_20115, partial [Acinetobacter baumannii]
KYHNVGPIQFMLGSTGKTQQKCIKIRIQLNLPPGHSIIPAQAEIVDQPCTPLFKHTANQAARGFPRARE